MFVKATNGQIDKYPYTVGDLRRDNPNTSFPKRISEDVMASFGVFPVGYEAAPDYDPMTHRLQHSDMPVLKDGAWVLTKTVIALTSDQIAARDTSAANDARAQRDRLLAETDWVVVFHTEKGTNIPLEWEVYRQALRDITAHANFPHLTETDWPVKP